MKVDMRYVCPKDVKKLLKQARSIYWKKWEAKHECEESKEGIWLELALALLRRRTKEGWTDKHRHVARKLKMWRKPKPEPLQRNRKYSAGSTITCELGPRTFGRPRFVMDKIWHDVAKQ